MFNLVYIIFCHSSVNSVAKHVQSFFLEPNLIAPASTPIYETPLPETLLPFLLYPGLVLTKAEGTSFPPPDHFSVLWKEDLHEPSKPRFKAQRYILTQQEHLFCNQTDLGQIV